MTSKESDLLKLAQQVSQLTASAVDLLQTNKYSQPSFSVTTGPVPETPEYDALCATLRDTADDLIQLVCGPKRTLRHALGWHFDLAAWQVALESRFFQIVPESGSITLAELAKRAELDEDRTGRIMRLLITQRVFEELQEDVFSHSASSIVLVKDNQLRALACMQMDEVLKAVSETSASIRNTPQSSDGLHSPFGLRHNVPIYQYYGQNPLKAARFAQAMAGVSQLDRLISELRDFYPWASLGRGKVVDMGGGSGHISMALARGFPDLEFVVQDINPDMLSQGKGLDMTGIEGQITFQQHDFFQPQRIYDASAFFLRQCIHNYNDEDSIKILRALTPALAQCAPGTPLLINDTILPSLGSKLRSEEHDLRQMDINMLVVLGAKQRTEKEFRKLFKEAHEQFEVVKVSGVGSAMGLLEVHFNH